MAETLHLLASRQTAGKAVPPPVTAVRVEVLLGIVTIITITMVPKAGRTERTGNPQKGLRGIVSERASTLLQENLAIFPENCMPLAVAAMLPAAIQTECQTLATAVEGLGVLANLEPLAALVL